MANTKISALTAATTPLAGTEVLPIVQSSATVKVAVSDLTAGRAVSAASLALTTTPLPATSGGTNQSSYAVGDLLYASTTTALSKLADVATGNALISGGVNTAPSYGKIGLTTHVSGTLPTANGGTNLTSFTANGVVYASSSSALATGSGFVFDGTNVGIGITPKSTLTATTKSLQLPYSFGLTSFNSSLDTYLQSNLYPAALGSGWANHSTGGGNLFRMSGGTFYWYQAASGAADANSSLTQAMYLDTSGNFIVGKTTAADNVAGTRISSGGLSVFGRVSGDATATIRFDSDGAAASFYRGTSSVSVTQVGSISVTTTATAYNTSSDYRLKNTIAPITGALAKVAQLKPVTYKWNANDSASEGFIAHELAEVFPQAVTGEKDGTKIEEYEVSPAVPATYDENRNQLTPAIAAVMGKREVPAYQGIDTSFLVATLTAAIQEQTETIKLLTARIVALESK
jgi:hypothetical protein